MAVLRLALANLRRKKTATLSFASIILVTVMLLDTSLVLLFSLPHFYDFSNDRLNGPHYTVRIPNNYYEPVYSEFFETDPRVSKVETEEIVSTGLVYYWAGENKMAVLPNFFDVGRERTLLPLSCTGPTMELPDGEGIYVPILMQSQGFELGSPLTFELNKKNYTYRIAGFIESTWFSTMTSNLLNFYLDSTAYQNLYQDIGGGKIVSVRLEDSSQVDQLELDYKAATGIRLDAPSLEMKYATAVKVETMRQAGTMITNMLSFLFVAFSFLILLLSLLVIRFRIANYIQDNIQNIGALQAIGYTSRQVRASLTAECTFTGVIGGVCGTAGCYGLLAIMGPMISTMLGVSWVNSLHLGYDLISTGVVLAVICITALLCTNRVRKLTVIVALRSGLRTHSFRRNLFPLEKTPGPLNLSLAWKAVSSSPWQYGMLALILCGVTFASAFSVITFHNFAMDTEDFLKLMGEESCDVLVQLTPHADREALTQRLLSEDEVEKVAVLDDMSVTLEDEIITVQISDDFSSLKNISVYEGSLPVYDNEIVITGLLAQQMGKEIGDTIAIEHSGVTAQYIICGLTQTISNFGRKCLVTLEGFRRMEPSYQIATLSLYLKPGTDGGPFLLKLEQEYPMLNPSYQEEQADTEASARRKAEEKLRNLVSMYGADSVQYALMEGDQVILSGDTAAYQIDNVLDQKNLLEGTMGVYVLFTGIFCGAILILAILIAALILHLVVQATIVRRKQEFGIYKALGYTSHQLKLQIAISFLPVSTLGIAVGSLMGGFLTGRGLSGMMYQLGISKLSVRVPIGGLPLLSAGILLFTFLVAMAAARPVKKISVYELFTE